jgi:hypothetical protein
MNRKEQAKQHFDDWRTKIRSLIRMIYLDTNSSTATIIKSCEIIEYELGRKPQEKQLIEKAYEYEIAPVVANLKTKLSLS